MLPAPNIIPGIELKVKDCIKSEVAYSGNARTNDLAQQLAVDRLGIGVVVVGRNDEVALPAHHLLLEIEVEGGPLVQDDERIDGDAARHDPVARAGIGEQIATPHEVFARPANVFVASFIGTPQMNLIEVDFGGMEGTNASLGLNSRTLEIEVDPAAKRLTPSRVTLGIRPRALTPGTERGKGTIAASAELIEPMGAETLIHARGEAGHDIRVVVPRELKVRIGEILHLKPDSRQTHLFDHAGKAVRS